MTESRFARYRDDSEFPSLWKPGEGDSRVGRLLGDREYSGEKGPVPVLDLVDVGTGEEWSFMSGAWRWIAELAERDPQPGDVVRITRHDDIGQGRDIRLEVLERAQERVAPQQERFQPREPAPPAAEPAPDDDDWLARYRDE
jgi:hypothetical protein